MLLLSTGWGRCFEYEENVKEHFNFGYEFYLRGDWQEALLEFSNVSVLAPDSSLGPLWCGICHRKLGNLDKAVKCLLIALKLDPGNADVVRILQEMGEKVPEDVEAVYVDLDNPFVDLKKEPPPKPEIRTGNETEELTQEVWAVMKDYLYGDEAPVEEDVAGMVPSADERESDAGSDHSLEEGVVQVVEPEGVQNVEGVGDDDEPQDWYASLDQCDENRKLIALAISLYNIDHLEPMNRSNFDLSKLLKGKYLERLPVGPSGGIYSLTEKGEVTCSVHY